jgi:hypothetical protein
MFLGRDMQVGIASMWRLSLLKVAGAALGLSGASMGRFMKEIGEQKRGLLALVEAAFT